MLGTEHEKVKEIMVIKAKSMKMTAARKKTEINGSGCGLVDVAETLHKSQLHTHQINRDGVCSRSSASVESHRSVAASDPNRPVAQTLELQSEPPLSDFTWSKPRLSVSTDGEKC